MRSKGNEPQDRYYITLKADQKKLNEDSPVNQSTQLLDVVEDDDSDHTSSKKPSKRTTYQIHPDKMNPHLVQISLFKLPPFATSNKTDRGERVLYELREITLYRSRLCCIPRQMFGFEDSKNCPYDAQLVIQAIQEANGNFPTRVTRESLQLATQKTPAI
jgi:hypothetical protein